jgi:peptidoglycan/LPS O-acetylase OafA/YrhL
VGRAVGSRADRLPNRKNVLTRLGDASFSIYVSHPIVLMVASLLWNRFYTFPADAFLAAALPAAIGVGLLVSASLECPLTRLLAGLPERVRNAPRGRLEPLPVEPDLRAEA